MKYIKKYFPDLSILQKKQFETLLEFLPELNKNINLISRKDLDNIEINHILHSLAIAKIINFRPETKILDVGTGGGFPGIPLAIIFPESEFVLIDSIGKKIKAVNEIISELGLKNAVAKKIRSTEMKEKFDFVTGRAVTNFTKFIGSVRNCIHSNDKNSFPNGIFYLKGGNFEAEIKAHRKTVELFEIRDIFEELIFETKKVIYLPV